MTTPDRAGAAGAAARVVERVRAVADSRATVEAYGSSVYAPAHADDVDVLVCEDDPARLASGLGLEQLPTSPPRLHGVLDGVRVDVTVVRGDGGLAERMRAGPRDAAMLAAQLRDHGRDEVFQAAWPHVRRFVQTRALGRNGLGWFGSFGWALLVAVPLVQDGELRQVAVGAALPGWLRWLARQALGVRIGFDGIRQGEAEPFHLAAPAAPPRDVARLSRRAATVLFGEARAAAGAIGEAASDAAAIERIVDLGDDPPSGTTLVIEGSDDQVRGRYDGTARGLLRELEALGATRSWGRFDAAEDGSWQHRITVPTPRARQARELVMRWLSLNNLDASLA